MGSDALDAGFPVTAGLIPAGLTPGKVTDFSFIRRRDRLLCRGIRLG
jgi:hypothetical protein